MITNYQFLDELFLRTPFYSFNKYDFDRLPAILDTVIFRNAILLASPAFYRQLEKKQFDYHRLSGKEVLSLQKYYNRMCYRPVPFGSFAAFTLLKWADGSVIRLGGDEDAVLHLLPDESLLSRFRADVPPLTPGLPVIINPTLYPAGNEYRFVKSDQDENGHVEFSLEGLPADDFYDELFARLRQGTLTTCSLVDWIAAYAACSTDEASDYAAFLLEAQVLFHSEKGNVIKGRPEKFDQANAAGLFKTWRQTRLKNPLPLSAIAATVQEILPGAPVPFYAAVERPHLAGGPSGQLQQDLLQAVAILQQWCMPRPPAALTQFIADFQARFDLEKVPLLAAIDPDAGIPYGNHTVSGFLMEHGKIDFPEPPAAPVPVEWTPRHSILLQCWTAAREKGPGTPIVLTGAELENTGVMAAPPPSIALLFRETAEQVIIDYAGGVTGISLLGRFTAFSEQVWEVCREIAAMEQAANPDVIFADIGQQSDAHVDNINRRKPIYAAEIPVNVYPHGDDEHTISPADLDISVRHGEIYLESRKHHKRVIPRLASAYHHGHTGLAIFRMLCDLQHQGMQGSLNFSLERFFPGLSYYPRVMARDIVISPASWRLEEHQLKQLTGVSKDEALKTLHLFKTANSLPRFVALGSADEQLVFDLEDKNEALFFLANLQGKQKATLTEYAQPARTIKAGNTPLAGQYAAILHHPQNVYKAAVKADAIPGKKTRSFPPGTEWLYLKIFCTPESADTLLTSAVAPFLQKYASQIDSWFFIRYFEQGHHIRLRILSGKLNPGNLLEGFNKFLVTSGNQHLVRNIQADTYRRELERYGPEMMDAVEDLFCKSSRLVLDYTIIRASENSLPSDFMFGLLTARQLLRCFYNDEKNQMEICRQSADRFMAGFSGGRNLKVDLDSKYREKKKVIEQVLSISRFPVPIDATGKAFVETAEKLALNSAALSLDRRNALLLDLIHMQLNRTFKIKHRQQEMMVYYFLFKHYSSQAARNQQ